MILDYTKSMNDTFKLELNEYIERIERYEDECSNLAYSGNLVFDVYFINHPLKNEVWKTFVESCVYVADDLIWGKDFEDRWFE